MSYQDEGYKKHCAEGEFCLVYTV